MCSINKDSLFIERCFIILHANDRSNSWSGWIWQSLTLLIFCTYSLQVFITCTVYSVYTCLEPRLSVPDFVSQLWKQNPERKASITYGFVLACYTREVHVTNVIIVPSIDR